MPSVFDEFCEAQLGDSRRVERLMDIVDALHDDPAQSFPEAVEGDKAALKGLYRFFSNPNIAMEAELKPHLLATWQRVMAAGPCFAVHDSSELVYSTLDDKQTRKGLEKTSKHTERLRIHPTLMVAADGSRLPLGVAAMMTWARTEQDKQSRPAGWSEQSRWHDQALAVEEHAPDQADIIHLMDRDADSFELLAKLSADSVRFIIRMQYDRNLDDPLASTIKEALGDIAPRGQRTIELNKRGTNRSSRDQKKHPPRPARQAVVSVRAACVNLTCPPRGAVDIDDEVVLNVVEVVETEHPADEDPVSWYLLTTEPATSIEECWKVVDGYCARWTIEEYFHALKSGCAVEERQLKSRHAIEVMLGVMLPLAWRVLLMRNLPRIVPDAPASALFSATELDVLRAAKPNMLGSTPTLKQACDALAALGGHLKHSGPPGWKTLWRGFRRLRQRHQGYLIAIQARSGEG